MLSELPNNEGVIILENMYNFNYGDTGASDYSWAKYLIPIVVIGSVGGW